VTEHLIDHRYTVVDIERMRRATEKLMFPLIWTSAHAGSYAGAGGMPGEPEGKVEVQLRTYMMAGIRPDELEALAKERADESERQRRSFIAEIVS
jgi:hypothetical protein